MTDLELGWFVGFFEGEGCFIKGRGKTGLTISQKQREPLDRVVALVGGYVKGPLASNHDSYRWTLSRNAEVLTLVELMRPLLSPRRQTQLATMVTLYENRPLRGNWWAKRTHCKHGHPFDEANTYRHPDGERGCRTCRRQGHITRHQEVIAKRS